MKRHVFTLLFLLPVSLKGGPSRNPIVRRDPNYPPQSCCSDICWPINACCEILSSAVRGLICWNIADNSEQLAEERVSCFLPTCSFSHCCPDSTCCDRLLTCTEE